MTGKKYNVGIMGYGWVSGAHIAAINASPNAQVTAVYSSRELNPAELSVRHGGHITCYTGLKAFLADEHVNVVSVCSYPHQHAEHAIAASQAGKPLVIGKPLALTKEDCQSIQK